MVCLPMYGTVHAFVSWRCRCCTTFRRRIATLHAKAAPSRSSTRCATTRQTRRSSSWRSSSTPATTSAPTSCASRFTHLINRLSVSLSCSLLILLVVVFAGETTARFQSPRAVSIEALVVQHLQCGTSALSKFAVVVLIVSFKRNLKTYFPCLFLDPPRHPPVRLPVPQIGLSGRPC